MCEYAVAHSIRVGDACGLRTEGLPDGLLDRRQHRGGQRAENDRIDTGGLTTEEEWSVGHDPQHGAPVAHSGLYDVPVRMAQDALLPEQIFDLFLNRANDKRADNLGHRARSA